MCKWKILGLSVNTINVCGMRYMSRNEMSAHEEAESVFNAVKVFFEANQNIFYPLHFVKPLSVLCLVAFLACQRELRPLYFPKCSKRSSVP